MVSGGGGGSCIGGEGGGTNAWVDLSEELLEREERGGDGLFWGRR